MGGRGDNIAVVDHVALELIGGRHLQGIAGNNGVQFFGADIFLAGDALESFKDFHDVVLRQVVAQLDHRFAYFADVVVDIQFKFIVSNLTPLSKAEVLLRLASQIHLIWVTVRCSSVMRRSL